MSTSGKLPESVRYCIIGAGIHGLSTAWHLARELKARGSGSGDDIVIIEKSQAGAGPAGIACGVVRNNYFQPAMRELMAIRSRCGSQIRRRSSTTRSATSRSPTTRCAPM